MDVALAAASVALATLLPSPFLDDKDQLPSETVHHPGRGRGRGRRRAARTVRLSLLLSLLLLGLAVLEAAPASWLAFLRNDRGYARGDFGIVPRDWRPTLTGAYGAVLWADCALIAAAIPAAVGAGVALSLVSPPSGVALSLVPSPSGVEGSADARGGIERGDAVEADAGGASLAGRVVGGILLGLRSVLDLSVLPIRFAVRALMRCRPVPAVRHRGWGDILPRTMSSDRVLVETSLVRSTSGALPSRCGRLSGLLRRARTCGTSGAGSHQRRALSVGALSGLALSLAALKAAASLVVSEADERAAGGRGGPLLLGDLVSRICAVGVLLSQVLNGFGCVSMPYSCLSGLHLHPISSDAVSAARDDLEYIRKDVADKRIILNDLRAHREHNIPIILHSDAIPKPYRRRCLPGEARSAREGDAAEGLRKEIDFLETLSEELAEEIEDMKELRRAAAAARTTAGRIRGWVGIVFSAVLLIRMSMAMMSAVWGGRGPNPSGRTDPITTALLWLVGHHLVSQAEYDALSQCISLILTAILSFSQVRTFLRTLSALSRRVGSVLRMCSGNADADHPSAQVHSYRPNAGVYLTASVMGCYFVACTVMMKRNLPPEYRLAFSAALGEFDFVIDLKVMNATFAASALASVLVLGSLFGIRRQNAAMHSARRLGLLKNIKAAEGC